MVNETKTVAVYAEHTARSGCRCSKPEPGDDAITLEVTLAEYKRLRRTSRRAGAGRDLFLRRCSRVVMEELRTL